jgi:hypothetical protein
LQNLVLLPVSCVIVAEMKRRTVIKSIIAGGSLIAMPSFAHAALIKDTLSAKLLDQAKAALAKHGKSVKFQNRIGIADYGQHSALPRFHIVDLLSGKTEQFLVAHGKGSDLAHTGWLQKFSNVAGSEASSAGAYLTAEEYTGKHGRSRRLDGLDPINDNARARAIVVHGAWYVDPALVGQVGKIGRSQGCFAFSEADLQTVLDRLGPGHLIYAAK